MRDNEFIAIGEGMVDFVYKDRGNDPKLVQKFFSFLCPENPPHKGETKMLTSEEWVIKIPQFGIQNGIITNTESGSPKELSQEVISYIFGTPTVSAGCAAANIFDCVARAKINGKPLVKSLFVTSVGNCESGQIFIDSIAPENLYFERAGLQKEAHIFEVDGDRIIIAHSSANQTQVSKLKPEILDKININKSTKMILVDGYLNFEGLYTPIIDKLITKLEELSPYFYERPTVVLNTACVEFSKSPEMRDAFNKLQKICPIVIVANADELGGLIEADESWLNEHSQKDWFKLKGAEFDKAAASDAEYQADKKLAHKRAMKFAQEEFCCRPFTSIEFLVTNGSRPIHVINSIKLSNEYPTKKPPFGVTNTVGAGDNFSGSYLLGQLLELPQDQSVELGSVAASLVIGQDSARLPSKQISYNRRIYEGVPAYLLSEREGFLQQRSHRVILENLAKGSFMAKNHFIRA